METLSSKKLTNHADCSFFSQRSVLAHLVLTASYGAPDVSFPGLGLDSIENLASLKTVCIRLYLKSEESCCKNVVKLTVNLGGFDI